jgi:hypothetical protein
MTYISIQCKYTISWIYIFKSCNTGPNIAESCRYCFVVFIFIIQNKQFVFMCVSEIRSCDQMLISHTDSDIVMNPCLITASRRRDMTFQGILSVNNKKICNKILNTYNHNVMTISFCFI